MSSTYSFENLPPGGKRPRESTDQPDKRLRMDGSLPYVKPSEPYTSDPPLKASFQPPPSRDFTLRSIEFPCTNPTDRTINQAAGNETVEVQIRADWELVFKGPHSALLAVLGHLPSMARSFGH